MSFSSAFKRVFVPKPYAERFADDFMKERAIRRELNAAVDQRLAVERHQQAFAQAAVDRLALAQEQSAQTVTVADGTLRTVATVGVQFKKRQESLVFAPDTNVADVLRQHPGIHNGATRGYVVKIDLQVFSSGQWLVVKTLHTVTIGQTDRKLLSICQQANNVVDYYTEHGTLPRMYEHITNEGNAVIGTVSARLDDNGHGKFKMLSSKQTQYAEADNTALISELVVSAEQVIIDARGTQNQAVEQAIEQRQNHQLTVSVNQSDVAERAADVRETIALAKRHSRL